MLFDQPPRKADELLAAIRAAYRVDETACVEERMHQAKMHPAMQRGVDERATALVEQVRARGLGASGIDAFMQEYELSSREGVVLMCLAEALLRIPDAETADRLISDKLSDADWERHLGHSDSPFVNASTWALMLTGKILQDAPRAEEDWKGVMRRMITRSGEPVIRRSVRQAMRILGRQFVLGRTIEEAMGRAREAESDGYLYSYDMLGEAARTMADAEHYFEAYRHAIEAIGAKARGSGPTREAGISVKLSALHPRYEFVQRERALKEITPRLRRLALLARRHGIGLTVDAEEADRLELSLEIIETVSRDVDLEGWDGFGLAVQAYQKRAVPVIEWLREMARRHRRRLMVRLVKGAYWDTEVKLAQQAGLSGYPVFTRKEATDVSYLACARKLLEAPDCFYPAFATHNAQTLAAVLGLAGDHREFEFQRLHGMGDALYETLLADESITVPCRIYAPVGSHEDLLAYLVRRLLENGANTSFVNRIVERDLPVEQIVVDPVAKLGRAEPKPHPGIPLPQAIYGATRRNSAGLDLSDYQALEPLAEAMERATAVLWQAEPVVAGEARGGVTREVHDPADRRRLVGVVIESDEDCVAAALDRATSAQPRWDGAGAETRGVCLDAAADLYETHGAELMAMAIREAGKTMLDAIAELREAVDFLRYYAAQARAGFAAPTVFQGPTGEHNELRLHGRGVFACISPWNFPLAIFTGQVAAALAAGNAVIAKPAEQTPLIAHRAVQLMHEAGVPTDVLHFTPGDGAVVGAALTRDPRVAGVAFTGSTETARLIQRTLAERDGAIVPLIAETGGQNAMLVDSSALPEQVVRDVIASAFQSAGQRCSALRVLFLQSDVADNIIQMLAGAVRELQVGDPALLRTDVGPVIDADALEMLQSHAARMDREAHLICRAPLGQEAEHGHFFVPCAYEIDGIHRLEREVFGPILHVVKYEADALDSVLDTINDTGYGLTLGIHSRIDTTVDRIRGRMKVGNVYVNRNQIGAVVGVQPFGGEGLSGTGPKAGGPHYLARFATERVLSVDTTAAGGNAALLALDGE